MISVYLNFNKKIRANRVRLSVQFRSFLSNEIKTHFLILDKNKYVNMNYRVEQAMNAQLRVKGKLQQFICQETINLPSL